MAYRYYNTNVAGTPQDGQLLPNGFVKVAATDSYQQLRERELALHRLMIEVFTMHNGPSKMAGEGESSVVANPLSRAQTRLLEDLRDMCTISQSASEVELLAAATNPVLQGVAASGVAGARGAFFDGVDDIPLDAPQYMGVANLGTATADDGGRIASSRAVASSTIARPISPTPVAIADPNDPLSLYSADVDAIHKEVLSLATEMVSDKTTEARRVAVLAALNAKERLLKSLLGAN